MSSQQPGASFPLGAFLRSDGANFSVFAKNATEVQLLLFDSADAPRPSRIIELDPRINRTYHYWHVCLPNITAGQVYAFRVAGPFDPERGFRFDPDKVLLDPYGKCIARPKGWSRDDARRPGDNAASAPRSVLADMGTYDWEDDAPPRRPFAKTIIYELHVGGFTQHLSSDVDPTRRGTFANDIYYILAEDRSDYADYTGCGNTLNANESIVPARTAPGLSTLTA